MKKLIKLARVKRILQYIKDKDAFIIDLTTAINEATAKDDPEIITKVLKEWEATAELVSIPGLAKRVHKKYNSLIKAGLIHE